MAYALLGHIRFDMLNAPTSWNEKDSVVFAQHNVLSGKPRLQAMGNNLSEVSFDLKLHHKLGNVERRYQALLKAQAMQIPLAFVVGMLQYKGFFVITHLSSKTLFTDNYGDALSRELSITLKEFVGNVQQNKNPLALKTNGNSPIPSIIPESAIEFLNQGKQILSKGVAAFQQVQDVVNSVRNVTTAMGALRNNPLGAINMLPKALSSLGGAISQLEGVSALSEGVEVMVSGIDGAARLMDGIGQTAHYLNGVKTYFESGLNASSLDGWFDAGLSILDETDELLYLMKEPASKVATFIGLREDH